jgi:hypothetical protein
MNRLLIFVIISIAIISCEPEAVDNARTPEFKQKIVAYCYLEAKDSAIYATVKYNIPEYGEIIYEEFGNPDNKVVISDGINEQEFIHKYDTLIGYDSVKYVVEYPFFLDTKNFPIIEGKEYTLKIKDYKNNQVESRCIIPVFRDINLQTSTAIIRSSLLGSDKVLRAYVKFTDFPNEQNFYKVIVSNHKYFNDEFGHQVFDPTNSISKFFEDKGRDGKEFSLYLDLYPSDMTLDSSFLFVTLLQTDKVYYDFHKSLENYQFDDNPFTEVTHLYSNITGGLGVFCGYTKQEYKIRIK